MGTIISLLTSKLGIIGIAALLLAALWGLHSYQMNVEHKRYDVLNDTIINPTTGYVARLAISRGNVAACTAQIGQANQRLEVLKAQADARAAAAEVQLQPLRAALAAAQTRVRARAAPIALPGETACATAARLIDEEIRR